MATEKKTTKKKVKHKEPRHVAKHVQADEDVRAEKKGKAKKKKKKKSKASGAPRQVSVDLGPIEPEVADVLALIDDAKGRPPLKRPIEPANERGEGGAAAKRGRGGRRGARTPEQPGLSKKDRASKQM